MMVTEVIPEGDDNTMLYRKRLNFNLAFQVSTKTCLSPTKATIIRWVGILANRKPQYTKTASTEMDTHRQYRNFPYLL